MENLSMQKNEKIINVIDLFSGCGGLSYGFSLAGMNILLGIDNDAKALETFKLNHENSSTICADIRKIGKKEIIDVIGKKKIDLIIGGPPCQGMSISGPRKFEDPRNELFLSFVRITKQIKPKVFVLENVPGLVGLFNGQIKDAIIDEFSKIGYCVKYKILNAADFKIPQNRKRVFFVGFLDKENYFEYPEPLNEIVSCENALSDLPENGLNDGEKYLVNPKSEYQKLMRENAKNIYNHQITQHNEKTIKIISLVPDGGNYKDLPKNLQNTRKVNIAWTRLKSKKPSFTIDTGHRHHFHYKYNRIPTVRESARIQSFPDNFIFLGNKTSQYKQVGNAVPPFLAFNIAKQLIKYL